MINFLISLIIAAQLVAPLEGAVLGASSVMGNFPKRKITGSFEPLLNSLGALAYDIQTKKVLFQKKAFEARPLASITKLMTTLVFLEQNPDLMQAAAITQDDRQNGGYVVFLPGERVKLIDVLNAALIGSVNSAAYALSVSSGLAYPAFIARMNDKARELGMTKTVFVEPTGISPKNQASAMDVAVLMRAVLDNQLLKDILLKESYQFHTLAGQWKKVNNTNLLLESYLQVEGGKTGYIDEAGYCLVNVVKNGHSGEGIIVVILGAASKEERFQENKFLSQWVFDNWMWAGDE